MTLVRIWERKMPISMPVNKDKIPIINVSYTKTRDILFFGIPSSIYKPSSFFLRRIKKLFAYKIRKAKTIAIKMERYFMV